MPALGARADQLGTTTLTDRTTQVTYAGHPLYYYTHEGKNQIRCPAATIAIRRDPNQGNALPRREESGHRKAPRSAPSCRVEEVLSRPPLRA
jgi:hypothetical protein